MTVDSFATGSEIARLSGLAAERKHLQPRRAGCEDSEVPAACRAAGAAHPPRVAERSLWVAQKEGDALSAAIAPPFLRRRTLKGALPRDRS